MIVELVKKIGLKVQQDGLFGLIKTMPRTAREFWTAKQLIEQIDSLNQRPASLEASLDLAFDAYNGFIRPLQVRSEILGLEKLIQERRPKFLMEIGTAKGGTLFLHSRSADDFAQLISVDLMGGAFGGGYAPWRQWLYRKFARAQQRIDLIQDDSHSVDTYEKVKALLKGNLLDVLFIDGDHTYQGVKTDFEMYKNLVRKGGLIALHDIAKAREESCDVDRFWHEIKTKYSSSGEFVESSSQGWGGIGWVEV